MNMVHRIIDFLLDFFYEMWILWFPDGFSIGRLFVLFILFAVTWMVLYGLLYVLDVSFRPAIKGTGKVIQKNYTPPIDGYMPVGVGGVAPYQSPERYELVIRTKDGQGKKSVRAHVYYLVAVSADIYVIYLKGRISHKIYIRKIGISLSSIRPFFDF